MRLIRTAVVLFAAMMVLLAGSARADAPLKFTDPPGDAIDTRPSQDIVSVTLDLKQVNKSGPPSLVFELELAAPPESQLATYGIRTVLPGCGAFQAQYRPGGLVYSAAGGAVADFAVSCEDPGLRPAQFRIVGNVLRWSLALDGLSKDNRTGTLEEINAYTSISEPVSGFLGTGDLDIARGPLPVDLATTDKTWSF